MTTEDLSALTTEAQNPTTRNLDRMPTLEMVQAIHAENAKVPGVVVKALPDIARAIEAIAVRMGQGGRLIYLGAGTSGRLGMQDAVECPPTFGVSPELVIALVAGGEAALRQSVEAAEDRPELGEQNLREIDLSPGDSLVGITASGRTPYVLGGLRFARRIGALTIGLTCNQPNQISSLADICIEVPTGPEVIAGSTRLKAGTATKMVLNSLSTGVMVKLGKTYGSRMVDVQASNDKLRQRAKSLVQDLAEVGIVEAEQALQACGWEVKTAVVTLRMGVSPKEARERLQRSAGRLAEVLGEA
jgi:N-acetylmuramic acid 6-phosphate etherase